MCSRLTHGSSLSDPKDLLIPFLITTIDVTAHEALTVSTNLQGGYNKLSEYKNLPIRP
jgi:hypothetical protein